MSDKYAALKQAAKNATPGEWSSDDHHGVIADAGLNGNYYIASCSGPEHRDNKRFIAAANPATILELLAERDADRARIAELEREKDVLESVALALRDDAREARMLTVKLPPEVQGSNIPFAADGANAMRKEVVKALTEACAAAGISLKIEGE